MTAINACILYRQLEILFESIFNMKEEDETTYTKTMGCFYTFYIFQHVCVISVRKPCARSQFIIDNVYFGPIYLYYSKA